MTVVKPCGGGLWAIHSGFAEREQMAPPFFSGNLEVILLLERQEAWDWAAALRNMPRL